MLGAAGQIAAAISTIAITAFGYGLGGAVSALSYARLREIKEGATLESLVDVFG